MTVAIGSDRNGFVTKNRLKKHLENRGIVVYDCGPEDDKFPVDYPIYGKRVADEVASGRCQYGIVICATGIGIMISANKVDGIRCGIGYTDYVAKQMREHIDANIIAFGQGQMNYGDIEKRTDIFLNTPFLGSYHKDRIHQICNIEAGALLEPTAIIDERAIKEER